MGRLADCDIRGANAYKKRYFDIHPQKRPKSKEEQILSLLEENPNLQAKELANLVNCNIGFAITMRSKYAKNHEGITVRNNKEIGAELREKVFSLLDKNPTIKVKELSNLSNCSLSTITQIRQEYAKIHGKIVIKKTKEYNTKLKEAISSLLDKNPELTAKEIAELIDCDPSAAHHHKQTWQRLHGIAVYSRKKQMEKNKETFFALLDKNPTLTQRELAKLANSNQGTAFHWKKRWLELHGTEQGEPQDDNSEEEKNV